MINAESVRMMKSPIAGHRECAAIAFNEFKGTNAINALVLVNTVLEDVAKAAEEGSSGSVGMTKDGIIATCMACGESTVDMDDYQGLVDLYNSEVWNYFTIIRWPNGDSHGKVVVKVDHFAHQRMNVTD